MGVMESVDVFDQLRELAVASRMRRLSDRIMADGGRIYSSRRLDFEPRWFPLFFLLSRRSPVPVGEAAETLGVTQPAVTATYKEMAKRGLVELMRDAGDKRRRLLALSEKGEALRTELEPLWNDIHESVCEIVREVGYDVVEVLERFERALSARSLFSRAQDRYFERAGDAVEFVEALPDGHEHFARLNYEWLEKYFTVEEPDRAVLSDPKGYILDRGGRIFFAVYGGEVVGTCALIKIEEGVYELAKMAVTDRVQGRGLGSRLLAHALREARRMDAHRVTLETSSRLLPALRIYEKAGFKRSPEGPGSTYARADVAMHLDLC